MISLSWMALLIVAFLILQGLQLDNRAETSAAVISYMPHPFQSRILGRGCDEALFSEKMGFSVKRGEAIQ